MIYSNLGPISRTV